MQGGRLLKRFLVVLVWVVFGALVFGGGFWAGKSTLQAPKVALNDSSPIFYTVSEVSVGKELPFAAVLSWPLVGLTTTGSGTQGVITSVEVRDGQQVNTGTVLYHRDLRPVVIAQGSIPAFRDLTLGVEGDAVTQLQTFLKSQKYLPASMKQTRIFDATIETGVKKWQKALNTVQDGVVQRGDIVYVDTLPVNLILSSKVVKGADLALIDEDLISVIAGVGVLKSAVIEGGFNDAALQVKINDQWVDIVLNRIEASEADQGNEMAFFTRLDGSPICPVGECGDIKASANGIALTARKVIEPTRTGPGVPLAALTKTDAGQDVITNVDVTQSPVNILGQGGGQAIVDGISVGQKIQIPNQS